MEKREFTPETLCQVTVMVTPRALHVGLRKSFGLRKKEAVITDFIAGEDFSIFNDTVLALLEAVPELRGGAINEGVTILWLK
jgi:hypothetical protein